MFNSLASQGSQYPLVVFQQMADTEDNETSHRARQPLYLVKAISAASMAEAGTISDAVEAALHGQHVSVSGWTNFWTARESAVRYTEVASDAKRYHHAGGVYRFRLAQ